MEHALGVDFLLLLTTFLSVLILVLVEHALGELKDLTMKLKIKVLILVLVEHALGGGLR